MSSKPKETTYDPKEEKLVTEGNVINDTPSYAAQVEPPKPEEKPLLPNVLGVVTNCLRLNVREKPDKNSDIVEVVNKGDTLSINPNKSTDGWYYAGNGYVMKEFITIL